MKYKFNNGDRVTLAADNTSHGEIVGRYSRERKKVGRKNIGPFPELYVVRWDSKYTENGLQPEDLSHE